MSGLRVHGRGAVHTRSTCTAPCATRSTARCPSRSATASTRSRWCERYGADALRYTLVSGHVGRAPTSSSIPTTSRRRSRRAATSPTSCGTRAASSCPISTARPARSPGRRRTSVRRDELTLADRWIIARCDATVREATDAYERVPAQRGGQRRSTGSSGATWPTGTSSRSSRGSTATRPAATSPGPWRPRPSTWRSACCIRSCRSSPRRSGAGFPAGRRRPRSRWRRGPGPTRGPRMPTALARVRPGAGGGGRHPRHPRRVRRAAGPDRACGREPGRTGADRARSSASGGTIVRLAKLSELVLRRARRAGRRARGALGRHRGVRAAGRRHRRRAASASGSARRSSGSPSWSVAGEEAGQRAVRLPRAGGGRAARAREARHLAGAARGAGAEARAAGVRHLRRERGRSPRLRLSPAVVWPAPGSSRRRAALPTRRRRSWSRPGPTRLPRSSRISRATSSSASTR